MYDGYNQQKGYMVKTNTINNTGWYGKNNKIPSNNSSWNIDCSSGWCIPAETKKKYY